MGIEGRGFLGDFGGVLGEVVDLGDLEGMGDFEAPEALGVLGEGFPEGGDGRGLR